MAIVAEPLDAPVGAVLSGVDGNKALSDRDFQAIEQALLDYLVVVIPDLQDDVDWLLNFGRRFGPLAPHILTRFHHPKTAEMSIISANMDGGESRTTAKPAGAPCSSIPATPCASTAFHRTRARQYSANCSYILSARSFATGTGGRRGSWWL